MESEVRALEAEARALEAETNREGAEATNAGRLTTESPTHPAAALMTTSSGPGPTAAPAQALQRREFVRRVTTDAVVMAGRFYSLSRVITRSASAAGQAVMADLDSIRREQEPESGTAPEDPSSAEPPTAASEPTVAAAEQVGREDETPGPITPATLAPAIVVPAPPATAPVPPPPVPLNLTPDQEALLERARSATLGVHRPGLSPHLTPAQFHWDGLVFRIPSLGWAARTTNVRREPRVTLFVEDAQSGEFGAISGRATIIERRTSVREQNEGLLRRYYPGADPDAQWAALVAEDPDRVLIVVEPDQTIWGRRA